MTAAIDLIRDLCNELDRHRQRIEAALAYAYNSHTFDDVCVAVLQNRVRFWSLKNSFMITEIIAMPQTANYHVWLAGGSLEEILAMEDEVLQAARDAECQRLTMAGRPGWMKPLTNRLGWRHAYVAMYKEVPANVTQGRNDHVGSEAAEVVGEGSRGSASPCEASGQPAVSALDGASSSCVHSAANGRIQ